MKFVNSYEDSGALNRSVAIVITMAALMVVMQGCDPGVISGDGVEDDDRTISFAAAAKNVAKANTAGTLDGKLTVTRNGGASYSIPIQVPPGTAGLEPELSLGYSSRGANAPPSSVAVGR